MALNYDPAVRDALTAALPDRPLTDADYSYWTNHGGIAAVANTFGAPGQASPVVQKPMSAPMVRPADLPTGPYWDNGYDSGEEFLQAQNANRAQQAAYDAQYPDMLAEYAKDTSWMTPFDQADQAEQMARGAYRPELQRLPSGQLVAQPETGGEVAAPVRAADGRIYKPIVSDDGGETAKGGMTGYELAEAKAKTPEELGLKLTPEQAAQVKGKRFFRYEKFDPSGKSLGYGYRPEDTRGFLKSVVQDLGPMISMALPFTGLSGMLAGGIGNLTGLGSVASNALAGGAIGGGLSAAGGGDFIKGALAGGLGGAVSGLNPAAQMGAAKPFQAPINAAIRAGGNAAIRGDSIEDAVRGTVTNPMQYIRMLGFADGGLIPGGMPDKVEAARMLASLPQEYRPMLSGIASNLMKG